MNAPEQRLLPLAGADSLWAEMQATESRERLCALWLRWLGGLLPECTQGVVLLDDGGGTLVATAATPEGLDTLAFKAVVTQAVNLRTLAIQSRPGGHDLALLLLQGGRPCGAVAVLLTGTSGSAVWQAAATIRWGMGWLRAGLQTGPAGLDAPTGAVPLPLSPAAAHTAALAAAQASTQAREQAAQLARVRLALDLSIAVLNQPSFKPAAMVLAGQLSRALDCRMVQVGWAESAGSRLVARSDSAWHEARSDLVRLAEQAMDEALDQACSVAVPAAPASAALPSPPDPGAGSLASTAARSIMESAAPPAALSAAPSAAPSATHERPSEARAGIDDPAAFASTAPEAVANPHPDPLLAHAAHDSYRRAAGAGALLTVPLPAHGPLVGAWLFERDTLFTPDEIDAAETLAGVLGPLLLLRHQGDESVGAHLRRKARAWLAWAVGERHAGWKLVAATAAVCLAVAAVWPVTHRVSAPSLVEGQTQRAAVAPFDGFVQAAAARAGDTVRQGQVLASLDDRDLQLQRQHWEAELEVSTRKEREALAGADRVTLRQAGAQADSARAQLELVREKLARLQVLAPFDGVVVKGDLSQRLGSPVQTGEVLFELAPLEAWRVILKVDERDIGHVQPGQRGELVLAGLPGQRFGLQAQRVLSVAEAEDGRNQFRVEAALDASASRLRPGMEGVAKLEVGQASLLWVWTHRAVDGLRRIVWEWTP